MTTPKPPQFSPPPARRLRVYAFDPHAALELGTAKISHATISLPWDDPTDGALQAGPINDYLEVIDFDPTSNQFYAPIDLNAPEVLAQDGLPPSEGDPRFHQQMVFAVVMKTIKTFERALGRKVIWRPAWDNEKKTYVPTQKLRVYPHALREANAYYSRDKRALLFGYFNASHQTAGARWIFTALSHDIIVHETTHAILDGLHPRYAEPTSEDSLAFHEAFADIAALFSHFQLYEAVHSYIARNGGRLDESNLLSGLAGQFAQGTTGRASLRDYIQKDPDPAALQTTTEAHERGAILVAAVFDAFLSIYTARTADLLRLSGATFGAGGQLHPDLTARIAKEATKSADHVLRMCIRALDYLPPVDIRFGEFLRAVITADNDLIPDDRLNYRLAFVEAFRRRGIFPENCLSMSPDNLLWDRPPVEDRDDPLYLSTDDILTANLNLVPEYDRAKIARTAEENRQKVWYWLIQPEVKPVDAKGRGAKLDEALNAFLARARLAFSDGGDTTPEGFVKSAISELATFGFTPETIGAAVEAISIASTGVAKWDALLQILHAKDGAGPKLKLDPTVDMAWESALGIFFQRRPGEDLLTIREGDHGLTVEVHSVRTTRRAGPDGQDIRQLVIEVAQRREGFFDQDLQTRRDTGQGLTPEQTTLKPDFIFRGGATMIIDLRDGQLRYVISKRINDNARLDRQRRFLTESEGLSFTYNRGRSREPFALLHRH
jgi:hypothetical protein